MNLAKIIACNSYELPISHPLILGYDSILIKVDLSHENIVTGLAVARKIILNRLSVNYLLLSKGYFVKDVISFLEGATLQLCIKVNCTF